MSPRFAAVPTASSQEASKGIFTSVCATGRLLDRVCALRYRAYLADELIRRNDVGRYFDAYDQQPNCQSCVTFYAGECVGAIRVCSHQPGSADDVPALAVFEREIRESVGLEQRFVELNSLVVAPEFRDRGGLATRLALLSRCANRVADSGVDSLIVVVPVLASEYLHEMGFKPASVAKRQPGLSFDAVLLSANDVSRVSRLLTDALHGAGVQSLT
ncbi:MAG TPA: hypothetical protein DD979_12300 [Gammaproteobacteria bacterium]|jgi:ribosomal protein S18 acetylase RimI-like enzyme|nr:hypothetical protein [Gammaproteobacteria bacterium]